MRVVFPVVYLRRAAAPPESVWAGDVGVRPGLEYVRGIPSSAAIRAAGFDFAVRYVDDPVIDAEPKRIRPGEYAICAGRVWTCGWYSRTVLWTLSAVGAGGVANPRRVMWSTRAGYRRPPWSPDPAGCEHADDAATDPRGRCRSLNIGAHHLPSGPVDSMATTARLLRGAPRRCSLFSSVCINAPPRGLVLTHVGSNSRIA